MQALVRLDRVSKAFREGDREHRVLVDASAEIAAGELVALLGPSGSGKSTLLNLIGGIDRPDAGQLTIDGAELSALDERGRTLFRRRRIGFVFQFFNLIPTLTVAENVLLPLELDRRLGEADKQRALATLERVGLADRQGAFPDVLSGGEQQRVALARALACQPALVLADEPTGNLDAETGAVVLDLLERLVREDGLTLLMVTHSAEAAARADRRLTIRDRQLVEDEA